MRPFSCPQFLLLVLVTGFLLAPESQARDPDHRDLAYAQDHETAQRLDVYLADSDQPLPAMIYLHGGGWRAGSGRAARGTGRVWPWWRVPGW